MNLKKPKILFLLGFITGNLFMVLSLFLIGFFWFQTVKKTPEEIAEQLKIPPIPSALDADYGMTLKTVDGQPFDFATLRGRPTFLTFLNPDCKTCQGELAVLEQLYQITQGDIGFALVARGGTAEEIEQVMGKFNLTVPIYMLEGKIPDIYNVSTVPATVILSPDGKIAFRHTGAAKWNDDAVVKFLLKMTNPVDASASVK